MRTRQCAASASDPDNAHHAANKQTERLLQYRRQHLTAAMMTTASLQPQHQLITTTLTHHHQHAHRTSVSITTTTTVTNNQNNHTNNHYTTTTTTTDITMTMILTTLHAACNELCALCLALQCTRGKRACIGFSQRRSTCRKHKRPLAVILEEVLDQHAIVMLKALTNIRVNVPAASHAHARSCCSRDWLSLVWF